MEALTWAIGAVITNGEIEIENFPFAHLEIPIVYLRESGMKLYRGGNNLIVKGELLTLLKLVPVLIRASIQICNHYSPYTEQCAMESLR